MRELAVQDHDEEGSRESLPAARASSSKRSAFAMPSVRRRPADAPVRRGAPAASDLPWRRRFLPAVLPPRTVGCHDVLVHVYSGTGAIVLQAASRYPLRRVIGIEPSDELSTVARLHLARSRSRLRCQDVQFITANAITMAIPDDVTIAYLDDPVRGVLFDMALDRLVDLVERRERGLRIVYVNPLEHDRLVSRDGVVPCPVPRAWRMRLAGLAADDVRSYHLWPSSPIGLSSTVAW